MNTVWKVPVHTESYNNKSKHVNADPRFCPLGGSIPRSLYDTFTPLLSSVAAEWIHGDRKNQIVVCLRPARVCGNEEKTPARQMSLICYKAHRANHSLLLQLSLTPASSEQAQHFRSDVCE